ncbi:HNH nuclease [Mycobacteroides abscessus subsp. abscessus]|uniref:HNH endonuclease n=1 Tax=Dermabacter TaxID=36739 RepID=UPI000927B27A|nr:MULTISPECIES: HNH endonuclease signature motif containing protein [Dermabacter]MCG7444367.1 HNH endonuclease [Dermabacter vaginalis]SHY19360.1 HNH nuclease [Mycobacteroides abscessus subsp. abscessus]
MTATVTEHNATTSRASIVASLDAPTRTDVLNLLLARSEGWQASLTGMLEAFPTALTSNNSHAAAPAHPATTPARVLDGPDLLIRLDVLESLTRIAELTEAVKAHILTELDETDGIGHLSSKEIATNTTSAPSRTEPCERSAAAAAAQSTSEDAAGVDPSAGLDSLSDKDRARVFAVRRALAHEVSLILKQSPYATSVEIARARMLTKNLPTLLSNLEQGRISINETHAITNSLRDATSTHAQMLDAPIARELERSPHAGKSHWRNYTSTALLSLDPQTALEREKKAFTTRRLTLRTLRNGMSSLTLTLRTLDATRIHDLLTHHAARAYNTLNQHEITTAKRKVHNHAQHTTTKLHSLLENGDFTLHHLTNTPHTPESFNAFNRTPGAFLNQATHPRSLDHFEQEKTGDASRKKAHEFKTMLERENLHLKILETKDGTHDVTVEPRGGAWRGHYQKPAHTKNNLAIDILVETLLNTRPNHPTTQLAPPSTAPGITLDPWTPLPHPHTNNGNLTHNTSNARQTDPLPDTPPPPQTPPTETHRETETTPTEPETTTLQVRGSERARRFEIGLLVPVNPDTSTAYIPDAGPITAKAGFDYLNELLDNDVLVKYKRIFTSATTGEILAMDSRSRLFPKALAELVRLRDRTCRGPYCDAPITHIDHIQRHAQGGPTTLTNAQGLCARCNLAKEALTVTLANTETTASTSTIWTTQSGRTYTSATPRYDS